MSGLHLKRDLFYTPAEVAAIFLRDGDLRWVYRHAEGKGFLVPFARKFHRKCLLFDRAGIDRLATRERGE